MDVKKLVSHTFSEGVRIGKVIFWRAFGNIYQNVKHT